MGVNDPTRLNVQINSTSYDAQVTDGGGPCFLHPDDTRPYSPPDADNLPDGYWVDVKAREVNVPTFFGAHRDHPSARHCQGAGRDPGSRDSTRRFHLRWSLPA